MLDYEQELSHQKRPLLLVHQCEGRGQKLRGFNDTDRSFADHAEYYANMP